MAALASAQTSYENVIVEKDVAIPTRDGHVLRCNIFRPRQGTAPAILSVSPYGKDMLMSEADPWEYRLCAQRGPDMIYERLHGPTWAGHGYAVVHIDMAGSGASEGVIDPWSARDADHYADAVEWAANQPWSTGKVGLAGLSYHSMTQPPVAARKPKGLACLLMWEVGYDYYRLVHDGGVFTANFVDWWWRLWVLRTQNGVGKLSDEQLAANRVDWEKLMREHTLLDDWWKERIADPRDVDVPFLTVANWCGVPVSTVSEFPLFKNASSKHKWLRVITGKHVKPMYDADSLLVQKRFLDYWLKGVDNGLLDTPRVQYVVRHRDGQTEWKSDEQWPLSQTKWTQLHLDATNMTLDWEPPHAASSASYHNEPDEGMWLPAGTYDMYLENLTKETRREGSSIRFTSKPFRSSMEITGPLNLTVQVSVEGTDDTDVFVTLRYISRDGYEVLFDGILDSPNLPVTSAVLRASHRALDEATSTFHSPVHPHDAEQLLKAGQMYELQIAVGPTSVVVEEGGRLVVEIGSRNGENTFCYLRNDPGTRKMGGKVTVHTGPDHRSSILLPVQEA
ncbi:acyl esterase [Violaceomyces palustris]|uniref:Acyl esterase n=1 Tax=Violaceomyces palustris TaxID=1673888 RepID=A0ACD0P1B3_9BASI|nr:acyl esterase [Violaceomyces palustris]